MKWLEKRDLFVAFLAICMVFFSVPVFTYLYYANDLKTKEATMNRNNTGVLLEDIYGEPFFSFYSAKNITFVPIEDIPKGLQDAVIAVEDGDFYKHNGFSLKALIGALIADLRNRDFRYGGSTITQQLVKNSLLNADKSLLRKYQEIVLAQEIERRYSKKEILEMYLNSVYFGEGAFGVGEAALRYFGKEPKELNLAESSLLAALLPAPSSLSPISGDRQKSEERRKYVIEKMSDRGFISQEAKEKLMAEKLVLKPREEELNSIAPHFALMVMDLLIDKYGEEKISRSGFKVKTTLNLDWQKYAEDLVKRQVERLKVNRVSNGSAVVIDVKTGDVRVLVGSKDWYNEEFGKVNIAQSLRQPGSAFKPVVYVASFEKGLITAGTKLKDRPINYQIPGSGDYRPNNYDRKFRGEVLVRRALANSLNVPSVEVMSKLGVADAISVAKRLGITSLEDPSEYGLSLVLGAGEVRLLELTNVYATFANEGKFNDINLILEIEDKAGNLVYQSNPKQEKVLDEADVFLISSILADKASRAEVFGSVLDTSIPAAVKTGTTEDFRDAWTMGYTPYLAVGVWVGNNIGAMDNIAGSLGAAPIFKDLIETLSKNFPKDNFFKPEGIVSVFVCKNNGLRLMEASNAGYMEYFKKGTEPKGVCVLPQNDDKRPKKDNKKDSNNLRDDIKNPDDKKTMESSFLAYINQEKSDKNNSNLPKIGFAK